MGIIYRNYDTQKRENELIKIAKACKASRNQLFVSNDIRLAIKVKAEGIYFPSFNKTENDRVSAKSWFSKYAGWIFSS